MTHRDTSWAARQSKGPMTSVYRPGFAAAFLPDLLTCDPLTFDPDTRGSVLACSDGCGLTAQWSTVMMGTREDRVGTETGRSSLSLEDIGAEQPTSPPLVAVFVDTPDD